MTASQSNKECDWGVPDWRRVDDYGDTEAWSDRRWRWEFTRRRPDYRQDFEAAWDGSSELDPLAIDLDAEEIDRLFRSRGVRALPFWHANARKYGLGRFYDPIIGDWFGFGPEGTSEWNSGLIVGGVDRWQSFINEEGEVAEAERPHLLPLTFDLRRPLAPQLKIARETLARHQAFFHSKHAKPEAPRRSTRAIKQHKANWLRYLRLLDARAAGASLSQMSREILEGTTTGTGPRTAGNMLAQAEDQMFRF